MYKCPECKNNRYFIETRDNDVVCQVCGFVIGDGEGEYCRSIDGIDYDRCSDAHSIQNKLVEILGPSKYAKFEYPRGWTYKALFHGSERIAQLDCIDPEIPASVMEIIRTGYRNSKYYKHDVGRKEISEILEPLTWPADQVFNKNKRRRVKSVRKVFLERWIRIRYELTGNRPPSMCDAFKQRFKELFCLVVSKWVRIRHGPLCPARTSDMAKCVNPRQNGCRHNLPNYNWIFQQLICHMIEEDPMKYGYGDAYLDYIPTLQTPKRRSKLEYYWKELQPHTKIPLYPVRTLRNI
jgi:hypothetical protein